MSSAVAQMWCRQTDQLGMRRRTGNGESTQCSVRIGDWSGFGLGLISDPAPETDCRDVLWEALGAEEPVVVDVVSDLEPRAPEPWVPA